MTKFNHNQTAHIHGTAGQTSGVAASPLPCRNMTDVRREIDRVDRMIVALIAERQTYIEQAGRLKPSRDDVRDDERVEDVVAKVRAAAKSCGASPELIETVYRTMIEWCINYEFTIFDQRPHKG